MKHVTLDIHNYPRMYAQAEALIERSTISARNKDFISHYRDACLLQQTCGKVRLIRVMGVLLLAANALAKDFDTVTREITYCRVPYDVETAAQRIRANGLPPWLAQRLLVGR